MKKGILTIIILLVLLGGAGLYWGITKPSNNDNSGGVMCTMEAKLCPDGSSVGRTGPKCEFAQCPSGTPIGNKPFTKGELTLGIGGIGSEEKLNITVNKVAEDSRCPINVQCIQAGKVSVEILLAENSLKETKILTLNDKPYLFGDYWVSVTDVLPDKFAGKTITDKDYKITFLVEKKSTPVQSDSGTLKGTVTLSPTCPVERIPPDPNCLPKAYQTNISIFTSDGTELIKTVQTNASGNFELSLPEGEYTIETAGGDVYPRCPSQKASVTSNKTTSIEISCDTGIR